MRRFALPSLLCLLAIARPAAGGEPVSDGAAGDGAGSEAVPVATRWSAIGEPSDAGYRLSLARGGLDIGLDFQRRLAAVRTADARFDSAAPPGAMLPALSFGLRSVSAPAPARNLVDRTYGSDTAVPSVSRVGIEYKPAQSPVFLNNGVGFRLGGEDKLTMRLRKGSLGLYFKRNF
jgi:hypothetical protein